MQTHQALPSPCRWLLGVLVQHLQRAAVMPVLTMFGSRGGTHQQQKKILDIMVFVPAARMLLLAAALLQSMHAKMPTLQHSSLPQRLPLR